MTLTISHLQYTGASRRLGYQCNTDGENCTSEWMYVEFRETACPRSADSAAAMRDEAVRARLMPNKAKLTPAMRTDLGRVNGAHTWRRRRLH